jgi:hypothetical protein
MNKSKQFGYTFDNRYMGNDPEVIHLYINCNLYILDPITIDQDLILIGCLFC